MRINNVSTERSSYALTIMTFVVIGVTAFIVWGYTLTCYAKPTFLGFFVWLYEVFIVLLEETKEIAFFPWIALIVILGLYIGYISMVISRFNAVKEFNNKINVKYIDLLPGAIEFVYTKPEQNFKCGYQDIKNLYLDIESTLVRTKNGSYTAFSQIHLTFTTSDGKKLTISNTTRSPLKLIYKIIDHTRNIKHFEYDFSGYGELADYREKIDKYLKLGYKDLIGEESAYNYKLLSIALFVAGLFFILGFQDSIRFTIKYSGIDFGLIAMLFPFLLFILISFIFDIILIIDALRDSKYRGFNGQK